MTIIFVGSMQKKNTLEALSAIHENIFYLQSFSVTDVL